MVFSPSSRVVLMVPGVVFGVQISKSAIDPLSWLLCDGLLLLLKCVLNGCGRPRSLIRGAGAFSAFLMRDLGGKPGVHLRSGRAASFCRPSGPKMCPVSVARSTARGAFSLASAQAERCQAGVGF